MSETEKIKKKLRQPAKAKLAEGLSSGSTLLNLAMTGNPDTGFACGAYYLLVGDSNSGKSVSAMAAFAEAANCPDFDGYDLYYDNPEFSSYMDITKLFGEKTAKRIKKPSARGDSSSLDEFYYNTDDALTKGPCLYVLDSMDALQPEEDQENFEKAKAAFTKGKEGPGSYGTQKAKMNSRGIVRLLPKLEATKSILIVLTQTRDNIGFAAQLAPKTRSGGKALRFFAQVEVWTSVKEKLKISAKGKQRQVGILANFQVKRSRFTGRERSVLLPIYFSVGIDDVGSMVDFLVEEKVWKRAKGDSGAVLAEQFGVELGDEKLIKHVEDNGLEKELRGLVVSTWNDIEKACEVSRKRRYE